ncbi:LTA synthase family protein [Paenibacillus crassostreae]|uniref:LTA synthase family protein n=1 Tax=Paenibacillus crassostreae TaxID=1763538 RepID=UPI000ACC308F|nr:LTA synthase family protein [Paenibacillus crassostreae]
MYLQVKIPNALFRISSYALFMLILLMKLTLIDNLINLPNIQLDPLDYVIALGSLMLVSFWTLWLPRRGYVVSLILLNIILTFIIYSDLVYYRYFGDFITVPVLLQTGQVSSLGESIHSLILWKDLSFFIDWILFILYAITRWILRHKKESSLYLHQTPPIRSRNNNIVRRFIAGTITLAIGYVLTFSPIKQYSETWALGLFAGNWWNMSIYNVTGLIGFHGYDIYRYAQEHLGPEPTLSQEKMNAVKDLFTQKSAQRTIQNNTFGMYKNNNVIVIQMEAMMNFVIGKSINGEEITPHFNKLMKESMYFNNYYQQTGQGRTSDADFISHSSLHALPSGSAFIRYPEHKYDMLPSIMKKHGYSTNAFHAYESSFWNRTIMYNNMSYDHFYSKNDYKNDEPLGWSLGDKSFFKQSLDKMNSLDQPFYSFLITLTSHYPYTMPKDTQQLNVGEFSDNIFGNYLHAIHYVDEALGQFVQQMKAQGIWDNTILVLYGDHDNSIKDKFYYEQFLGKNISDLDMKQIMNQVPLLIHLPDNSQVGEYTDPAGQIDLSPSLLHLLGIPTDSYHMLGNNLFAEHERQVILRSGAVINSKLVYIPSPDGVYENGNCYDLNTRDTTEITNCRVMFDQAALELNISDQVIQYNLISKLDND